MRRRFIFKNDSLNQICYTTTDNNKVSFTTSGFDVFVSSHTYNNGRGIITFNGVITNIGLHAFYNCDNLLSITIPNSVTEIGYGAFSYCTSLSSVNIPNSVTSIDDDAFNNCISLVSVTIGNRVTSIGKYAFSTCSSLTNVNIPNSVTSIGGYAFSGCKSLKSATIPNNVTSIGDYAFWGCTSLNAVYCQCITPPVINNVSFNYPYIFINNAKGRKIYVPQQSLDTYKTAEWWSYYASDIVEYDFNYNDNEEENGSGLTFPINIEAGENGQVGIDLYHYLHDNINGMNDTYIFKDNEIVYVVGYKVTGALYTTEEFFYFGNHIDSPEIYLSLGLYSDGRLIVAID